jgi:prepilin-type N-terminal cleavage/methylation domain-containing protein
MKCSSRGFTLIELLVVIAIIGILSAVVLASLNSARSKGNDAAVRQNLLDARSQIELFYILNGDKYVGTAGSSDDVCASGASAGNVKGAYDMMRAAATTQGVNLKVYPTLTSGDYSNGVCRANATQWVISMPLKKYQSMTSPVLCMDSTGINKVTDVSGGGSQPAGSAYWCS